MRIYKMTATFGKLSGETLTLEPGLNIITAPNEWGKSTWCAFLMAMLYGLDTRAKTTKTALADKERYAPWSGVPMEGRIDLNWKGRDITIQRRTKRRVPLGEFSAFETESGLEVPELTAANCGQMLLGVEQTVFRRAGFIRSGDMPVTQDEALRRRLNALVTTGDENGAADRLAESLKDLKNRCRYNRSGLLPQEEREREGIWNKLEELNGLEEQRVKLLKRQEEGKQWIAQLENHRQTLDYAKAEQDAGRLAQAREARDQAETALRLLEGECQRLPSREEAEEKLRQLRILRDQWNALQLEQGALPRLPEPPRLSQPFLGMTVAEARDMVRRDKKTYTASRMALPILLLLVGVLGLIGAGLLAWMEIYLPAAAAGGAAAAALLWSLLDGAASRRQKEKLVKKYGTPDDQRWEQPLIAYVRALEAYREQEAAIRSSGADYELRSEAFFQKKEALCGSREIEETADFWLQVQQKWEACHNARRDAMGAQSHFDAISAVVRPVEQPKHPDPLTYSEADTLRLLSDGSAEQQRLHSRLGQIQGRMESLGDKGALEKELERKNGRIAQLEDTYWALTVAQETLAEARAELQRRFAPRIAKRAQELISAMTGGRYHSLTMGEDFSLRAGAGEENTLRETLWRSDGTMDQLYLALRLAVAEELTPEAPLILDDAFVRFDDQRMTAAVELLREMGEKKQILCFTCQSRESEV